MYLLARRQWHRTAQYYLDYMREPVHSFPPLASLCAMSRQYDLILTPEALQ